MLIFNILGIFHNFKRQRYDKIKLDVWLGEFSFLKW